MSPGDLRSIDAASVDGDAPWSSELDFDLDPVHLAALDRSIEQHRLSTAAALGRDSVPARDTSVLAVPAA